jgi:hypothetical protein
LVGARPLARTHQQGVARQLAQPLELRADRRLRTLQLERGAGDTAFGDEHVQDPDEMKLDLVQMWALRHTLPLMAVMGASV